MPSQDRSPHKKKAVRDAIATQANILDAAEVEFARHGLKGARIQAIAKNASVTTAMIHYYFQNKEGLYRAVLKRPLEETQDMFASMSFDDLNPEEAITAFIRGAIAYESEHVIRQMLWFQEACQNRGEYFKEGNWPIIFAKLTQVLEDGIEQGYFRPLDTSMTLIHILSVCIFYFTVHENWKHITPGIDRLAPEEVERHTSTAIEFILGGLRSH